MLQPLTVEQVSAAFPEFALAPARLGPSGFKFVMRGTRNHKDVVLKIPLTPLPDGLDDEEVEEFELLMDARFRHEIEGMRRVDNPHVAKILLGPDTRIIADHRYVWYLEPFYPTTLALRLATLWASNATVDLITGLLRGAEALATHGIVHRDIKPPNVAFDDHDRPVLLDLGAGLFKTLTTVTGQDEMAPHTPGFCAPEQMYLRRHRPEIDHRTDMFCVGILGFIALTGRHPFRFPPFGTPDEYRQRLLAGAVDMAPLQAVNANHAFQQFFIRILAAAPNGRFRHFRMAYAALEGCA